MSKQPERRRRIVRAIAPAVGLLAAGLLVWQGSYAAFSATTNANSNAWSTGNLKLENNSGGTYAGTTTADFGGKNIKPGDSGSTCLTVKSSGSLSGDLRMYVSSLTDANSLAPMIDITVAAASTTTDVKDCSTFPTTGVKALYTTTLNALPTTYATAGASDVSVATGTVLEAYKISWTLDATANNSLMSSTATAGLTWEIQ